MRFFAAKQAATFDFVDTVYEKKGYVATITINRPEIYNAYSTPGLAEMAAALKDAAWDDSIAVIVLTGAGDKAFCTGGDVAEYQSKYLRRPRDYWKFLGLFSEVLDLLRNSGKPVIARINGMCVGGGNELNMACDLAVMADSAYIRQVGTRVGSVAAGGATQWLPILVGDRRARELLFACEPISAEKALDWGLVNQVVPYAELDQAVAALAEKLVDKFPECTRYTKQQVNFWKDFSWHQTIGHARDWLSIHFNSVETWEGMNAFVEKRKPDYRGVRARAAGEETSSEYLWGPYAQECASCGAKGIPASFQFCGACGADLKAALVVAPNGR